MLQRTQTLFLTGIVIVMGLFLNFKIWVKADPHSSEQAIMTPYYLFYQNEAGEGQIPTFYIAILAVISIVLAAVSIFQFKNRLTQIKLNMMNTLVMVSCQGLAVYFILVKGNKLFSPELQGNYQIGFVLPVFALLLNSFANYFIKKDENLVRSVDRLR